MTLSEVNFSQRMSALQNKQKTRKRMLPFVAEYRPSMPDLKHILMNKSHLIQNRPSLRKILKHPPLISCRKGRSVKDVRVRAKLRGLDLKHILMNKSHLIQNRPSLRKILKHPPLISCRKGRSVKDVRVRAKLRGL